MTANCICRALTAGVGIGVGSLSSNTDIEKDTRDSVLVRRVISGDKASFRELVEKYQNKAVSVAFGVVGNLADAEEIAQEAFLKAYRNLNSFRGQSSFYTWLYRIVFNLSIDLSRKRYRRNEYSVGDLFAVDASTQERNLADDGFSNAPQTPEQLLSGSELGKEIDKAMAELSPEHRAVIMLREIQGLSYEEISEVLDCSKGTVMSRLHHARRRLQRALVQFMPEDLRTESSEEFNIQKERL